MCKQQQNQFPGQCSPKEKMISNLDGMKTQKGQKRKLNHKTSPTREVFPFRRRIFCLFGGGGVGGKMATIGFSHMGYRIRIRSPSHPTKTKFLRAPETTGDIPTSTTTEEIEKATRSIKTPKDPYFKVDAKLGERGREEEEEIKSEKESQKNPSWQKRRFFDKNPNFFQTANSKHNFHLANCRQVFSLLRSLIFFSIICLIARIVANVLIFALIVWLIKVHPFKKIFEHEQNQSQHQLFANNHGDF